VTLSRKATILFRLAVRGARKTVLEHYHRSCACFDGSNGGANNLDIKVSIDEESHQRVGSPEVDLRTPIRPRNPRSVQTAVEVNDPLAFHGRLTVAFVDSRSVPSFFPSSGNRRPRESVPGANR